MQTVPIHAALLGFCSIAGAQINGTATWLWDVSTQNGDTIVEPGETAMISLSIDMDPDVDWPNGTVLGLGGALFDTLGGVNADKGGILTWELAFPFSEIIGDGDTTTTDGTSLFNTFVIQTLENDVFSPADPITVLIFEWDPRHVGSYSVQYATDSSFVSIITNEGGVNWNVQEAAISFEVIPSPAAGTAVVIGCVLVSRRQRGTALAMCLERRS